MLELEERRRNEIIKILDKLLKLDEEGLILVKRDADVLSSYEEIRKLRKEKTAV